jgi:quercetin dioxygenase-like cupin family protein
MTQLRTANMHGTAARTERAIVQSPGEGEVIEPFPGVQMSIKVAGADTGGTLAILEWTGAPGTGTPPGIHHRDDETVYLLDGEFTAQVGRGNFKATAGSFVYVPKGTVHAFRNTGTAVAHALFVFAPAGLEGIFEELAQLPAGAHDRAKVAAILQRYHTETVAQPGA